MTKPFSDTYAEAREKFLSVVAERGASLVSAVHPSQRGAQGEDLAIDIGTFGDPSAEKTLLVVSGTHGQEGFLGSALQIAFLRDVEIPEGMNVVALHALNPWGFSHLSRTDEKNIDVNRNFTDYDEELPQDDLYPMLFKALCPDDWTEETADWSDVLQEVTEEHGHQRLVTALAGGQIVEPTGITFVGREASWSRRTVEELLPAALTHAKKVAFIEWHTGIGEYGELCHICSLEPGTDGYEQVIEWLGEEARTSFTKNAHIADGKTPNYRGFFSAWLPSTAPQAQWAGLLIEVGTYDDLTVMDTVRIDRWLRFAPGRTSTSREEMRATMMEGLNPLSNQWRNAAIANGLEAERRMFAGLQNW